MYNSRMSIRDFAEKIKAQGSVVTDPEGKHRIFLVLTLFLTASFAFGLGRISVAQPHNPITVGHFDALPGQDLASKIAENPLPIAALAASVTAAVPAKAAPKPQDSAPKRTSASVFASKSGTRYYPQGCKAGNRVSEANKIWFENAAAAELVGLSKGATCK